MNIRNTLIPTLLFCLLLSVAHAESSAWRSPLAVPGATTVSVAEAKRLHDLGVSFVDVRNPRLYQRKHIPGAHHLDLKNGFSRDALEALIAPDEPLLLYCSGVKCSRSSRAAKLAVSWGYQRVYYFREGVIGWKKAGLLMKFADGSLRPVNADGQ